MIIKIHKRVVVGWLVVALFILISTSSSKITPQMEPSRTMAGQGSRTGGSSQEGGRDFRWGCGSSPDGSWDYRWGVGSSPDGTTWGFGSGAGRSSDGGGYGYGWGGSTSINGGGGSGSGSGSGGGFGFGSGSGGGGGGGGGGGVNFNGRFGYPPNQPRPDGVRKNKNNNHGGTRPSGNR